MRPPFASLLAAEGRPQGDGTSRSRTAGELFVSLLTVAWVTAGALALLAGLPLVAGLTGLAALWLGTRHGTPITVSLLLTGCYLPVLVVTALVPESALRSPLALTGSLLTVSLGVAVARMRP